MCVKMNEDIAEIIAAEILKRFGKYVSVGAIWLKKTRKSYIYHTYYVSERSFYKIHQSERLPLNYALKKAYRTSFDRTSSVLQYETRTFDNRLKTTLTLDMSRNDVICT